MSSFNVGDKVRCFRLADSRYDQEGITDEIYSSIDKVSVKYDNCYSAHYGPYKLPSYKTHEIRYLKKIEREN